MSRETIRRQHRYTITPEHLILDPRISDRAMRLWCRLDRYAGDNESAFPSRLTLAIEMDTSKASIDRALKELCDAGWLSKERRRVGDVNAYTLIVAPEKAVQRLIEKAREERRAAAAPQLERERELRRMQKRGSSVQASEDEFPSQVSEGGVVTSDDTLPIEGVVTHDDTSRHGCTGGVLTGDEEKEAPEKEATQKEATTGALAALDAPARPLSVVPDHPPEPKSITHAAQALTTVWVDWHAERAPVLNKQRTYLTLLKSYVVPALESGYTEVQVREALKAGGTIMPTMIRFREELVKAAGGVTPVPVSDRTRQNHSVLERAMERARQAEAGGQQ